MARSFVDRLLGRPDKIEIEENAVRKFIRSLDENELNAIADKILGIDATAAQNTSNQSGSYPKPTDDDGDITGLWSSVITDRMIDDIVRKYPLVDALTFGSAEDAVIDRFTLKSSVNPDQDEEIAEINLRFQRKARKTKFWSALMVAAGYALSHGFGLMVKYTDEVVEPKDLENDPPPNAEIAIWVAYRPTVASVLTWDAFGQPERWIITLPAEGGGDTVIIINASRVHIVNVDIRDNRWRGRSLVENAFAMFVTLNDVARGSGEAFFRWGTGRPTIITEKLEPHIFERVKRALGYFTRRTNLVLNGEYFKELIAWGNTGVALDPMKFIQGIIILIAGTIRIPQPVIAGAMAGRLTGSEFNDRRYMTYIEGIQRKLEDNLLYDLLRGWIPELDDDDLDWEIEWPIRLVETKVDKEKYKDLRASRVVKEGIAIGRKTALNELGYNVEENPEILDEPPMSGSAGEEDPDEDPENEDPESIGEPIVEPVPGRRVKPDETEMM